MNKQTHTARAVSRASSVMRLRFAEAFNRNPSSPVAGMVYDALQRGVGVNKYVCWSASRKEPRRK